MQTLPMPDHQAEDIQAEHPVKRGSQHRSFSIFHMVETVLMVGVVLATLFTMWNPHGVFFSQSSIAILPTPVNVENEFAPASMAI